MRHDLIEAELRKLLPYAAEITIDETIVVKGGDNIPENAWWSLSLLAHAFGTHKVEMRRTLEGVTVTIEDWSWSEKSDDV